MTTLYPLRAPKSLLIAALLAITPTLPAQSTPTLEEVLTKVHQNFLSYLNTLPNLYADEHLTAATGLRDTSYGRAGSETTYDSTFRLRRTDDPKQLAIFVESRQIQAHDHHPVTATDPNLNPALTVPVIIKGAFSYAAAFVSPALQTCYDYNLEPNRRLKKQSVLVLTYTYRTNLPAGTKCPVTERHTGRAFIDPATMQVLRFEQKRPEYPLNSDVLTFAPVAASSLTTISANPPGTNRTIDPAPVATGPALGDWDWSIDYAPVTLNAQTFWLPKTITSTIFTTTGPRIEWSFVATYTNYHLLYVTTDILPGYKPVK